MNLTVPNRNMDRTYGHIDMETGDDTPHVDRSYTLFTNLEDHDRKEHHQAWTFMLRMPKAIDRMITPNDWEFVLRKIDTRELGRGFSVIEAIITGCLIAGASSETMQTEIAQTVTENVYRIFCQKQINAGNKAWVVPSSMQARSDPNG